MPERVSQPDPIAVSAPDRQASHRIHILRVLLIPFLSPSPLCPLIALSVPKPSPHQLRLDLPEPLDPDAIPLDVGAPAYVARARRDAVWVEAGGVVEGEGVGRVTGAEDVAAVTAVVAADEKAEGCGTAW